MITRRQAIKTTALAAAAAAAVPQAFAQNARRIEPRQTLITNTPGGPFKLPRLPYAYDALEPYIDARTMEIHHDRHHRAYVDNLNKVWAQFPWKGSPPDLSRISYDAYDLYLEHNWLNNAKFLSENPVIRNNGGGHYNHSLFWQMMKKGGGGEPTGELAKAIETSFDSFGAFKNRFSQAALGQFGSGWAWLVLDGSDLQIESTANQDTPLSQGKTPLLGLDVWEHAYYLKYQNRRADYIAAWWNVVNWDFVADCYTKVKG